MLRYLMTEFALSSAVVLQLMPAFADIEADTAHIVQQTANRDFFEAAIQAQRPIGTAVIENQLRSLVLPSAT